MDNEMNSGPRVRSLAAGCKAISLVIVLVASLLWQPAVFAKAMKVTGTVSDENGEPLIGASVICKGSTVGTTTDIEGRFTIEVPESVKRIEFRYVGMATQEMEIAPVMNVVMHALDSRLLDEVIVVAFGEQKKSSFTGSAGVVKADEIKNYAVNDAMQAMQGKLAGVQLKTESGSPTATPSIRIRGTGSINASNEPLYIVDGSPMVGSSYLINPEDVESITVLKDAASNALYGARGANGVIMITTKKGKAGTPKITLNAKFGMVTHAIQEYEKLTDPRAYYEMAYRAHYNREIRDNGADPASAHITANNAIGKSTNEGGLGYVVYSVPEGEYLIGSNGKLNPAATLGNIVSFGGREYLVRPDDWMEESLRTGFRQDYTANVSGGVDRFNYYATFGYLNNEGIVKGSEYERYTLRLKTDWELRSWLSLGLNMSYVKGRAYSTDNSVFTQARMYAPIYPMYIRDADGNRMYDENGVMFDYGDGKITGLQRPFAPGSNYVQENALNMRRRDRDLTNVAGNITFTVPWVKGLKAQAKINASTNSSKYLRTYQPFYGSDAASNPQGRIHDENTKTYAYNLQQLITYVRQFGPHNVNAMIGHEYYNNRYEELYAEKTNMFSYWGNQSLDGAVTVDPKRVSGYNTEYNTEGWLSRLMYDYQEKYFVSASYRRDASSRFHPDHRWGNFFSVGGAWIPSKESWFPKNETINLLKVKASWGQQGNDGIGDYLYTTIYDIENVNGDVGLNMSTIKGVKNITWETNSNFNVGVEFELLNNRLSGEVEYFNRKTTDMLCEIRVPLDAGYSSQYANVGDMRNSGIEFSLNYDVVRNRDLVWNIYANATHYKNKILRLNDDNKGTDLEGHPGYVSGSYFYGEGLSIHSWRLKRYAGVDPSTGLALYYKTDADTKETTTTTRFEDGSYYYCGTSDPDLYGGFGTTLSYKGFDVAVQFNYSIGGKAYDSGYSSLMINPSAGYTAGAIHKDMLGAWSESNRESNIPRYQYATKSEDLNVSQTTDRFLMNASSLSLQNVNIGYNLPAGLLRKVQIDKARFYVSVDNLCYWSKRKGFDPRNSYWGSTSVAGYALTRTWTLGVELGF